VRMSGFERDIGPPTQLYRSGHLWTHGWTCMRLLNLVRMKACKEALGSSMTTLDTQID
jgi:hypothetical protein